MRRTTHPIDPVYKQNIIVAEGNLVVLDRNEAMGTIDLKPERVHGATTSPRTTAGLWRDRLGSAKKAPPSALATRNDNSDNCRAVGSEI